MEITNIKGAEVALKFIKLRSELSGRYDDWFDSSYPYTQYRDTKWNYESKKEEPIEPYFTTYIDCSDWFYWGSADAEELTDDNFYLLEDTVAELLPLYKEAEKKYTKEIQKWMKANEAHGKEWREAHPDTSDPEHYNHDANGNMTGYKRESYQPLASPDESIKERIAGQAERLFSAKVRKMRPQGAAYKYIPEEIKKFYDAAGPARDIDILNPRTQSTDKYEFVPNESVAPSDLEDIK